MARRGSWKTWAQELAAVAILAASCAWALPRAVLPAAPSSPSRLVSLAHAAPPPAAAPTSPPTVVTIRTTPSPDDGSTPDEAPAAALPARPREARGQPAVTSLLGGAIARRRGVWVADLRALPPVRSLLAGTQFQLPGEGVTGGGYRVVRTDRNGLLSAAGIRPGDVLVGVDDLPLRSPDDVIDAVARLGRATRATFVFRRGEDTFRVPVEVVGRGAAGALLE